MLVSPALVSSLSLPTLLLFLGIEIQLVYTPDRRGFQKGQMVKYLCMVLPLDVLSLLGKWCKWVEEMLLFLTWRIGYQLTFAGTWPTPPSGKLNEPTKGVILWDWVQLKNTLLEGVYSFKVFPVSSKIKNSNKHLLGKQTLIKYTEERCHRKQGHKTVRIY